MTLLGNKLSTSTEESIFFIPIFQRKPYTCNMADNGSNKKVTAFKILYNFKKSNNKELITYSQAQTFQLSKYQQPLLSE